MPALRGLRRDGGSRTVPKVLSRADDDGGVPNATRIPPIDFCSDGLCGLRGLLRGLVLKSDRNLCFAKSVGRDIGRDSDRERETESESETVTEMEAKRQQSMRGMCTRREGRVSFSRSILHILKHDTIITEQCMGRATGVVLTEVRPAGSAAHSSPVPYSMRSRPCIVRGWCV